MKRIQKIFLIGSAGFIVFIASMSFYAVHKKASSTNWEAVLGDSVRDPKTPSQVSLSASTPVKNETVLPGNRSPLQDIMIDVKGAVEHPGVYSVKNSSRLVDVIQIAGGFLKEADSNQLNLAERVQDEMVIYVPKKGENVSQTITAIQSTLASKGPNPSGSQTKVHLNTASESELEVLPGIGPTKAKAIIDYRQKNGPFAKIDDLANVTGIGAKTVERLKSDLSLN